MQHADRIKSTLPSLLTVWIYLRMDLSDTWNRKKRLQKIRLQISWAPAAIEMPQMEAFTYPDTIQTGGFGIVSGTIQNSQ